MEQFTGSLLRDHQAFVEGVSGRLSIDFSPTHQQRWSGFFNVPNNPDLKLNDHFVLSLADGRTGNIKIDRINVTTQGMFVSFGTAD